MFAAVLLLGGALSFGTYSVVQANNSLSGVRLKLQFTGNQTYYLKEKSPVIKNVLFEIRTYSREDFSIRMTDLDNQRFEVPKGGPYPNDQQENFTFPINASQVLFEYKEAPFSFKVINRQTK